jgi:hypothetical protein
VNTSTNAHFASLPLAEVRSGMILADVVRDGRGSVLLSQGVVLNATLLASLARHGIAALAVHLPEQDNAAPAIDADAIQARLDQLFRNHDRDDRADWATGTLRRYVEHYRLQDARTGGQP